MQNEATRMRPVALLLILQPSDLQLRGLKSLPRRRTAGCRPSYGDHPHS